MSVTDKTVAEYLKRPFPARLNFSQEDDCWFVRYPDLRGCMADGATPEEALRNGEEAKEVWIASALKHGQRIPEPAVEESEYSGRFLVRGSRDLHRRLAEAAERQGASMNRLCVQFLTEALTRRECEHIPTPQALNVLYGFGIPFVTGTYQMVRSSDQFPPGLTSVGGGSLGGGQSSARSKQYLRVDAGHS